MRHILGSKGLFTFTIFVGSFLLFMVQPMIARMAMPELGGAPAVWNSAMLVYQALLLIGYGWAHALARLPGKMQAILHGGLLALACLWLPLGLASMDVATDTSPVWHVPALLTLSLGPLFVAVAAQAPLMQRWYGLAGNKGEPYSLYAASNFGSFGGLLAYPLLVEPFFALKAQSLWWTIGYVLLAGLVLLCAFAIWRAGSNADPQEQSMPLDQDTGEHSIVVSGPIRLKTYAYWLLLSAVPSALMLSTTTHLTTDLVSMPLVWVIPLGLYLLSFSVAFSDKRGLADMITRFAAPLLIIFAVLSLSLGSGGAATGMLASVGLLFIVAVALHAEMYRSRPSADRLTAFYLTMSLGGVIGGFFCAIIAPIAFSWTWEHAILLLLVAFIIPQQRLFSVGEEQIIGQRGLSMIMLGLSTIAIGIAAYLSQSPSFEFDHIKMLMLCVIIALGILVIGNRLGFTISMGAILLANGAYAAWGLGEDNMIRRSYFGVYRIMDSANERTLIHGTTLHGIQLKAQPTKPISYYGGGSGVGLAFPKAEALYGPDAAMGVVGLGSGTLSCYAKPGQNWTFYEIDPLVVDIATDPDIFTFISKCQPRAKMKIGDARLTLAENTPAKYDMLALDAFSSDAIPMHLMTREAFAVYGRALKPDGMLLVHISNRYIDLEPMVALLAKDGGWHAAARLDYPNDENEKAGMRTSVWIALSRNPDKLAQLTGALYDEAPKAGGANIWLRLRQKDNMNIWTDDYASILPHLKLLSEQ